MEQYFLKCTDSQSCAKIKKRIFCLTQDFTVHANNLLIFTKKWVMKWDITGVSRIFQIFHFQIFHFFKSAIKKILLHIFKF